MSDRDPGGSRPGASSMPLAGVRVADFSRVLAGPYATMMLADFGADVIKIEGPSGDDTRGWRPPVDANGESSYFGSVNRNKRGVVLDFAQAGERAEALRLAASADVVIENFRPGVMAKFGLDYASVSAVNPRAIYCSITGFGSAAGAGLAGYDLLVQAVGGLMSITGEAAGAPSKVGVALVDVICGQNALAGILLALRARETSGRGQRLELDLMTGLLSALTNQAAGTLATGLAPERLGNAHPSIAPYSLYSAADRDLVIAVGNERQFCALVRLLGAPALADDPRYADNVARVTNREALDLALHELLAADSAANWVGLLADAGVPAGLVNSVAEAIDFASALGLPALATIDGAAGAAVSASVIANPIHLSDTPARYRGGPPRLGQHNGADWLDADSEGERP